MTPTEPAEPSATSPVPEVVEHLFRRQAGRLVAALTRLFGLENLPLAEDVVQEALLRALQVWPFHGIPRDPPAWILQVARRLALDLLRRDQNFQRKQEKLRISLGPDYAEANGILNESEIADDQLRMMFACCHPELTGDTQVALILKTICGFGIDEIAAAFLTGTSAIAKKLVRARKRLRDRGVSLELPGPEALRPRLDAVLQALYLLFNEGYKSSQGGTLIRREFCHEAIRLATELVRHPVGSVPQTHALLALMLFNAARLDSRLDPEGQLLLLAEQDRTRWNASWISLGMQHLIASGTGRDLTEFHLQAGIASLHCLARSHADTDWKRILELYDLLLTQTRSPIVALNRAVAVARVQGPAAALEILDHLSDAPTLRDYYLLPAVRGQLLAETGRMDDAAQELLRASRMARVSSERALIQSRLDSLTRQHAKID